MYVYVYKMCIYIYMYDKYIVFMCGVCVCTNKIVQKLCGKVELEEILMQKTGNNA